MNDTTKVEDRFHALDPASKKIEPENPLKTGLMSQKAPGVQKAPGIQMKFLPEGKQVHEVKQRGFKFTYEKNYPVLERKDYRIKTVDDNGREMWMKEDYFTTAHIALYGDKEFGFTKPIDKLEWDTDKLSTDICEWIASRFLCKTDLANVRNVAGACYKTPLGDLKTLSGVKTPNQEKIELKSETTKEELEKNKVYFEQVSAPLNSIYQTDSFGKVNPLLMDLDKLAENMGKVFPEYRKVDTDGLMTYIRSRVIGHKIEWNNCGILTIDGAKTNIVRADVNIAFDGLKKLASPKMADKLVGKVIVAKLKKLF